MLVKELIELLNDVDDDKEVYILQFGSGSQLTGVEEFSRFIELKGD
jgi:hypothetical protein